MKKNYIKPDMQVVKLQHKSRLLVGSGEGPNGYNNQQMRSYRGEGEHLTSEDEIF